MRPITLAIIATLILSGCDSDHERLVKELEKQIRHTISKDWQATGIPLNSLLTARSNCQYEQGLRGCDQVTNQLIDISNSYASCLADHRSKLSEAMVKTISQHPILAILPKAAAFPLPCSPWYWSLPTYALESQAGKFDYRTEVAGWWWETWSSLILSCTALLVLFVGAWKWSCHFINKKQQLAEVVANQRTALLEQRKAQEIKEEEARIEDEIRAKLAHDEAILEQERITSENFAKRKSAEAAAKLAAEQAQSAELLASIFNSKKSVHRNI